MTPRNRGSKAGKKSPRTKTKRTPRTPAAPANDRDVLAALDEFVSLVRFTRSDGTPATEILLYHNITRPPREHQELNPDKRPGAPKYILRVPIVVTP